MAAREDAYINKIPWGIALRLSRALNPEDKWEELLGSIQDYPLDGHPLDPDFRGILNTCHLRRQSPTERLLSELGHKGYKVKHLKLWLSLAGLQRALDLLEGVCMCMCMYVHVSMCANSTILLTYVYTNDQRPPVCVDHHSFVSFESFIGRFFHMHFMSMGCLGPHYAVF